MGNVNLATAYVRIIPTVEGIQGNLGRMFGDAGDQAGSDFNRGFGQNDPGGAAGESFLGGLKNKAMLGIAGIAAAAGAVFVDAYNEAVDRRQSEAKAQASLGLTPEEAKGLGAIAGRLYSSGYGEGLGELTDQVATVKSSLQNLQLPDAQLERLTAKAISFGQAFDTDVADSVQSVSTLVGSGLVTDVDKAFDLITKSSQKVPAALRGDVLSASDEYSQFFRTLGFSGDQAFDALVKGAEKGTFGIDKTGDAIKEFTIRSTDMSAGSVAAYDAIGLSADDMSKKILAGGGEANTAFQQIVDGILAIQDPTTQANTAIGLFGTQMEDMNVADVPEFLKGLKGMSGGLGDVAGAADQMDTAMGSTTSGVELFWRNLKTNIVDFITEKVLPVVTEITRWLGENLGAAIQAVAGWLVDTFAPAIRHVADWMSVHLGPAVQMVADLFTNILIPAAQAAWSWFEENLLPTIQRVGEFIVSTFENIGRVLGGIIDFIVGVFTGDWSKAWEGIKAIFGGIWDQIVNVLNTAWDVVTGIGGKILDWLSQLPGWAWDKIKEFAGFLTEKGQQFLQWIWDGIVTKAEEVWVWFTNLPGEIWSLVAASGGWVLDRGKEFIGWIKDGIVDGATAIWQWFIGLPAKAWEFLNNLKENIKDIGKDFVNWIVDGIKGAAQAVADAVSSLFELKLNEDGTGYVTANPLDGGARGAVVPGRDPGRRDNVLGRLPNGVGFGLRSEEAIMVPEFTHAAGGAAGINRLNRLAEQGMLEFGFARGGVISKAKAQELGASVSKGIADSILTDNLSGLWDKIGDDVRAAAAKAFGTGVAEGSARDLFIKAMLSKQGTSYVWGAAGPNVFDCSGLVSWALTQAGVGKGRLTAEGFNSSFPKAGEAPGNLVTFDTGRLPGRAGHIGAIVDVARGLMMHTDGAGPARVSDYKSRDGGPLNIVDAIGGAIGPGSTGFTGILSGVKGVLKGAFNNAVGPSGEAIAGAPEGWGSARNLNTNSRDQWNTQPTQAQVGFIPPGGALDRWDGFIAYALQMIGADSPAARAAMKNQVRTESSGIPWIMNRSDINFQRGYGSKGLIQLIGPTFDSYAYPGYNTNIVDPASNLMAGGRYAIDRYGSITAGMRGVAYDLGGWLMPGITPTLNLLNRPEAVLTPPQSQALVSHAAALEAGWWGGEVPAFQIFIGDQELKELVDVRIVQRVQGAVTRSRQMQVQGR